jgi:hypothetical protein
MGLYPFPDANRFILGSQMSYQGQGVLYYDMGQWPWEKPTTLVGSISRDLQRDPYMQNAFPGILPNSYRLVSTSPLSGIFVAAVSGWDTFKGTTIGGQRPVASLDGSTARNVPMIWTAMQPQFTVTDIQYPAPLVNYDMQGYTGQATVTDRSGNGFNANTSNNNLFDNYGWYNSGIVTGIDSVTGNTCTGNPVYSTTCRRTQSLFLPFNTTLANFTMFFCFGHVPGPPIGPVVSGEIALQDGAGLSVVRNGATSTWTVTFLNTVLASVPIPEDSEGCIVLDKNGNNVTLYVNSDIQPGSATAFVTATISGSWTPSITLSANSGGLLGVVGKLVIYPHLTDAQIEAEMEAIRHDCQLRKITLR